MGREKAWAGMRGGWKRLGGDMSWEDYGGTWVKRLKGTTRYFVIRFENGHEYDPELPLYMCDLLSVDVGALLSDKDRLQSVLRSCGWRMTDEGIVSDQGDVVAPTDKPEIMALVLVESAVGCGAYAPMGIEHSAEHRPLNLRALVRREADDLMRDESRVSDALARPVNRVGSTADEYERGDLDSALERGPFDTAKNLMRRLHGLAPMVEGE